MQSLDDGGAQLQSKWLQRFPWVRFSADGAARCSKCDYVTKSPTSFKLNQHEKSLAHLSKTTGNSDKPSLRGAPSVGQFQEFVEEKHKGMSARGSGFGQKKSAKMLWCINEAILERWRRRFKNAMCSCVTQDVRQTTLSVRFSAVGKSSGQPAQVAVFDCHRQMSAFPSASVRVNPRADCHPRSRVAGRGWLGKLHRGQRQHFRSAGVCNGEGGQSYVCQAAQAASRLAGPPTSFSEERLPVILPVC